MNEITAMEKTGRNEPCPCGSGKKFKKCHGGVTLPPQQESPKPNVQKPKQSEREKRIAESIPWGSLGRESVASRVGHSLLPVGLLPFEPVPFSKTGMPAVDQHHPDVEKLLMNIVGTAVQVDSGKLVTCAHVVDAMLSGLGKSQQKYFYILTRTFGDNMVYFLPYRVQAAIRYYDPRTGDINDQVDLSMLLSPPNREALPYETPNVKFGDSGALGVGDPIVVGGYPLGREMFLFRKSNRGLIQPTFYSGIVSAIIPATKPGETRLLQLSIPVAGGMSGGAVFLPDTGEVVGMITSCLNVNKVALPMSTAIPSEIIAPYVELVTFTTDRNKKT